MMKRNGKKREGKEKENYIRILVLCPPWILIFRLDGKGTRNMEEREDWRGGLANVGLAKRVA